MNLKGKYSQSSRDDDDSCADERVFASIGERSSADFGFAEVKLNSLTHYLYLSMLLSVGPVDVCTVGCWQKQYSTNDDQVHWQNILCKYGIGF